MTNVSPAKVFAAAVFSAAVFLAFVLPFLGYSLVFQMSEAREGAVIKRILETGEYILPMRHGETIPSKPILFHWIGAAIAQVRGTVDEIGLRAPSALAAAALVACVSAAAAELGGFSAAFLSLMIFLTTYGFVRMALDGRVDMLFTLCTSSAIMVWLREVRRLGELPLSALPSSRYYLIGVLLGLSILAKGPLGLFLPVLVIFSISFFHSGFQGIKSLLRPGWLLAIAVALPWYFLATLRGSEAFLLRQIFFENVNRFVGGAGITVKPVWFYVEYFWAHGAPWSVVFAVYLAALIVQKLKKGQRLKNGEQAGASPLLPPDPGSRFYVKAGIIWFVVSVFFLSLSAGKRRAYLLPTVPAMALTLTFALPHLSPFLEEFFLKKHFARFEKSARILWYLTFFGYLALFLLSLALSMVVTERSHLFFLFLAAIAPSLKRGPYTAVLFFSVLALFTVIIWRKASRTQKFRDYVIAGFAYLLFVTFGPANFLESAKGITHSYKNFTCEVAAHVPAGQELVVLKKQLDESFDTMIFYYPAAITVHDPDFPLEPGRYYLCHREWFEEKDNSERQHLSKLFEGGRQADSVAKQRILFRFQSSELSETTTAPEGKSL